MVQIVLRFAEKLKFEIYELRIRNIANIKRRVCNLIVRGKAVSGNGLS
jgi:hypothetical protein